MASSSSLAGYVQPVTAALLARHTAGGGSARAPPVFSGPKRTAGGGVKKKEPVETVPLAATDETGVVALFQAMERMPGYVVARLVLNEGDPLVNMRPAVLAAGQTPAQLRSIIRKIQQGYRDDPLFWKKFVTTCFPRVTKLPPDTSDWHEFAIRIFDIIASIAIVAPVPVPVQPAFEAFGTQPVFMKALASNLTCNDIFADSYLLQAEFEPDNDAGITPSSGLALLILSEHGIIGRTGSGPRYDYILSPGISVTANNDDSDAPDDDDIDTTTRDEYHDWTKHEMVVRETPIHQWNIDVTIVPAAFIRDRLFERINARRGPGEQYTAPATSPYRSIWSRVVPPAPAPVLP